MTRRKQLADCCTASYYQQIPSIRDRDFLGGALIGLLLDSKALVMQYSPLVYGFYPSREISLVQMNYSYAEAYSLIPVLVLALCLVLLIPQIGTGIKVPLTKKEYKKVPQHAFSRPSSKHLNVFCKMYRNSFPLERENSTVILI